MLRKTILLDWQRAIQVSEMSQRLTRDIRTFHNEGIILPWTQRTRIHGRKVLFMVNISSYVDGIKISIQERSFCFPFPCEPPRFKINSYLAVEFAIRHKWQSALIHSRIGVWSCGYDMRISSSEAVCPHKPYSSWSAILYKALTLIMP